MRTHAYALNSYCLLAACWPKKNNGFWPGCSGSVCQMAAVSTGHTFGWVTTHMTLCLKEEGPP